jgi:hypothetical protein
MLINETECHAMIAGRMSYRKCRLKHVPGTAFSAVDVSRLEKKQRRLGNPVQETLVLIGTFNW